MSGRIVISLMCLPSSPSSPSTISGHSFFFSYVPGEVVGYNTISSDKDLNLLGKLYVYSVA